MLICSVCESVPNASTSRLACELVEKRLLVSSCCCSRSESKWFFFHLNFFAEHGRATSRAESTHVKRPMPASKRRLQASAACMAPFNGQGGQVIFFSVLSSLGWRQRFEHCGNGKICLARWSPLEIVCFMPRRLFRLYYADMTSRTYLDKLT